MWRKNKKVLIIALIAAVVVIGSIGGVMVAQAAAGSTSGNTTQPKPILARVAEILGIDQTKLEGAVKQATSEQELQALTNRLQKLVANGKITQAQMDQYLAWWKSKPDTAPYQQSLKDWQAARPQLPSDLKTWEQARPKLPGVPNIGGGRGGMMNRGSFGRGGMMGGFGGRGMMGGAYAPAGPVQ